MDAMTPITTEVDAETLALIDSAANFSGVSRADFMVDAARRIAESRAEFQAFLQVGIDDLDAGRSITHEEFGRRIRQWQAERKAS